MTLDAECMHDRSWISSISFCGNKKNTVMGGWMGRGIIISFAFFFFFFLFFFEVLCFYLYFTLIFESKVGWCSVGCSYTSSR